MHNGDFNEAGDYLPHSQIEGDLRAIITERDAMKDDALRLHSDKMDLIEQKIALKHDIDRHLSIMTEIQAERDRQISFPYWWVERTLKALSGDLPSGQIGDSIFLLREMLKEKLALSPPERRGRMSEKLTNPQMELLTQISESRHMSLRTIRQEPRL